MTFESSPVPGITTLAPEKQRSPTQLQIKRLGNSAWILRFKAVIDVSRLPSMNGDVPRLSRVSLIAGRDDGSTSIRISGQEIHSGDVP